jgi:hypothetical protein
MDQAARVNVGCLIHISGTAKNGGRRRNSAARLASGEE